MISAPAGVRAQPAVTTRAPHPGGSPPLRSAGLERRSWAYPLGCSGSSDLLDVWPVKSRGNAAALFPWQICLPRRQQFSTIDTGNPVRFDQVSHASAAINRPLSNTDTDRAAGGE